MRDPFLCQGQLTDQRGIKLFEKVIVGASRQIVVPAPKAFGDRRCSLVKIRLILPSTSAVSASMIAE